MHILMQIQDSELMVWHLLPLTSDLCRLPDTGSLKRFAVQGLLCPVSHNPEDMTGTQSRRKETLYKNKRGRDGVISVFKLIKRGQ